MSDLTSIIENAVAEAEAGGDVPDPVAGEGETIEGDEPVIPEGDEPALETAEEPAEGDEPAESDEPADPEVKEVKEVKELIKKELSEVEKILEAAGIKAPVAGQKENKIPYTRTVKIIGNALKKATDAHTASTSVLQAKHDHAEARAKAFENADRIATENPDEYMRRLAVVNPAYQKYLTAGGGKTGEEPAKVTPPLGEKAPGPDVKFEDGTFGYSPEQAQKREDWIIATAEERAFKRAQTMYEERFGPIEKAAKTREAAAKASAERLPVIRQQIAEQKEVWGDLFPADGTPEQLAVSKLLTEGSSLAVALNKVLLPKVRQSRESMRADILKEQKARPAAARRGPVAAKKAIVDPNEVRGTEAVIRDAIAAAGLEL